MEVFEGKTAVVTGGASGIGRALADRFGEARMNVVLADIEEAALERAVAEMEERQVRVKGVVTDTMRRASIEALADEVEAEFGDVHILCNNAGVASMAGLPVWELPDSDWDWVMGVNFSGVLDGIRTFVPRMLKHGEPAHIVSTASLAGLLPGGGPYGVSKHAVLSLSEGLKRDLTAVGANIGVSVLCPGFVNTNIFDAERNRPDGRSQSSDDPRLEGMADMLRGGKEPSDIAEIVFESIRRDAFYILPHPAWDDIVRGRIEAVLAREGVYDFDFTQMAPPADGERY